MGMPFCPFAVLSATNTHLRNYQSRGGHGAAKLQVRADSFQVHQHLLQRAGDGDLRNWKGQLAIANPETGGAAGIIPGDDINTETDQLSYIGTVADSGNQLLRRGCA